MPCDPFRQNHKRIAADALLDIYGDIDNNNLFLSIGKILGWVDDNDPPSSTDSVRDDTDFWRGVFAHKRIDREDVSLVVRRYDWKPGATYSPYRDNVDLFDDVEPSPFYVLVDEERVYKCIDNNNDSPSFYAPTHVGYRVRTMPDGYRWKFLYQIPESKRKFLTKTQGNRQGYMPVEYVEYLRQNDERILQWRVQQDAVDGEISHIELNSDVQPFVVSTKCVFPNADNTVVSDVDLGATGITVASPYLFLQPDYYNDMILSIDNGTGLGQTRVITGFVPSAGGNSAFVTVQDPFSSAISGGAEPSNFSIVPHIKVVGDGTSYKNSGNPYTTAAELSVRFGATADVDVLRLNGVTACAEFFEPIRTIDSIEIIDGGKNYTFATLEYVNGLVVPTGKVNLQDLAEPIMSPQGGHGSNPVKELGASAIMIVKEYNRTESGKVSTENEYRQFGLILNPLLEEKQVRIRFFEPGVLGTFQVGATAQQQATGPYDGASGKVVSWLYGVSGHSGTNELVLTNVRGGNFEFGGIVSGLTIMNVDEKTIAGTDARRLLRLSVAPTDVSFLGGNQCRCTGGNDFLDGFLAHGIGNYEITMPPSRSVGEIYRWEPRLGTNKSGYLYLENVQGEFKRGERIAQTDLYYTGFMPKGLSGVAEITDIQSIVRGGVETYDQTTILSLSHDGINLFDSNSFFEDEFKEFAVGTTSANGYVMDWAAGASGTTGTIRLSGTQGRFVEGMQVGYRIDGAVGGSATINEIIHSAELKYRSGEILYIQNMKPIQRGNEQKEEIKIVINF